MKNIIHSKGHKHFKTISPCSRHNSTNKRITYLQDLGVAGNVSTWFIPPGDERDEESCSGLLLARLFCNIWAPRLDILNIFCNQSDFEKYATKTITCQQYGNSNMKIPKLIRKMCMKEVICTYVSRVRQILKWSHSFYLVTFQKLNCAAIPE